jgi:nucleoside-diphosphate-sugar epimerase
VARRPAAREAQRAGRRLSRVLVLGGTGFIGAALVRRLRALGCAVSTFHRGPEATIRGDRASLESFRGELARAAPEVVVDTIAYSERDGVELVRAFRGLARRVVVLSSQDVYGAYGRLLRLEEGVPEPTPLSEDSPLRRSRHPYRAGARPGEMAYDYDKVLVEAAVGADASLPATIVRLPCVYGPGDRHHRLGTYLERMRAGSAEILLDRAKASWRWTRGYVEDVADAIALAAADPRAAGRVYNVGEQDALTEAQWVGAIGAAASWEGEIREVSPQELPAGLAEPYDFSHDLAADTRRIRAELGYRERIGRDPGLRIAVADEW